MNESEDSRRVSRELGDQDKGVGTRPGEGTVWGSQKGSRIPRKYYRDDRVFGEGNGRVPFWNLGL